MIRTLLTLHRGTKQDGSPCLKGELPREITTTASDGSTRVYPAGTPLVLTKHARGTYSLLAMLPEPVNDLRRESEAITQKEREQQVPF